jgi:aminoglycoside/choline kinase family phosphotransferase
MHRDLQSRNIMVKDNTIYFIDFQGGRMGPIQYDLASLLHDPYVNLPEHIKTVLFKYCVNKLKIMIEINAQAFASGYWFCSITRLMQALGAFGYLSRVKGKTYFESYIPVALTTLQRELENSEANIFVKLKKTVKGAAMKLDELKQN